MKKIEHIGIAVSNLKESSIIYEKLFGSPSYKQEEVASEGVKTAFFMSGPNKIELLEATNPESPVWLLWFTHGAKEPWNGHEFKSDKYRPQF